MNSAQTSSATDTRRRSRRRRERLGPVRGDPLPPQLLEVVAGVGQRAGDLREHRALGPVGIGRERRSGCSKPGSRSEMPDERHAPHRQSASTSSAARWAVRLQIRGERLREVGEPMAAQPRQADAHEHERVEPQRAETRPARPRARGRTGRSAALCASSGRPASELRASCDDGCLGARAPGDHLRRRCR